MYWDRQRTVHYPVLAIQFVVCVGCWVLVVLSLGGKISSPGLIASIVTGCVLVLVTWLLAKFGIPPQSVARPSRSFTAGESATSEAAPSD